MPVFDQVSPGTMLYQRVRGQWTLPRGLQQKSAMIMAIELQSYFYHPAYKHSSYDIRRETYGCSRFSCTANTPFFRPSSTFAGPR